MPEEKPKRKRQPLPDGVAGYLTGCGVRVPVPVELVDYARLKAEDREDITHQDMLTLAILGALKRAQDRAAEELATHRAEQLRATIASAEKELARYEGSDGDD